MRRSCLFLRLRVLRGLYPCINNHRSVQYLFLRHRRWDITSAELPDLSIAACVLDGVAMQYIHTDGYLALKSLQYFCCLLLLPASDACFCCLLLLPFIAWPGIRKRGRQNLSQRNNSSMPDRICQITQTMLPRYESLNSTCVLLSFCKYSTFHGLRYHVIF